MKIRLYLAKTKNIFFYNFLIYFNKNNKKTKQYIEEGFSILSQKVDNLPEKVAFRPKFIHQSSCVKILDKIYLYISKANLDKPKDNKFDALFHEIGHWLHFQNLPPKEERQNIWKNADLEKIKNDVSEYAVKRNEGLEFVPEVFKFLIKGKKFDKYIMDLYNKLNGPKVKDV